MSVNWQGTTELIRPQNKRLEARVLTGNLDLGQKCKIIQIR